MRILLTNDDGIDSPGLLALRQIIVDAFRPLTGTQVVERLERAQIANAQVNTMKDVWAHPQLEARGRWTDPTDSRDGVAAYTSRVQSLWLTGRRQH